MIDFAIKISSLIIFSIIIFFFYYSVFPGHYENLTHLIFYFCFFSFLYFLYKIPEKYFSLKTEKKEEKKEVVYSFKKISSVFLIILFSSCFLYFNDFSVKFSANFLPDFSTSLSIENIKNSFVLFFRIIFFSAFPILVFLICSSFGKFLSNFFPKFEEFGKNTKILFSLNFGFFIFLSIISIFSFFGIYNLTLVFSILSLFFIFSFKEFFEILKHIFGKKFEIEDDKHKVKIFLLEFFYFFTFFALSVGLIYIFRPFPRGWDELGVYMNFPNILAYSSGIGNFGEMYSWQIFTGIGYLFGNPTFAYFLNFSGYFLSFLTLNLIFSEIFKNKKNSFLNPAIIFSSLFLALPMSVFHSIKDLKVDQALFFLTSFIVYFFLINLQKLKENKNFPKIYFFIIGLLVGLAFSIKFTTLFLIISILATLSFFFLGFFGFFGFFSILFSIFSYGNLWNLMNISLNTSKIYIIFSFILGIIFIILGFLTKKKNFFKNIFIKEKSKENNFKTIDLRSEKKEKFAYFKVCFLFLFGIFLALAPWFLKNIYETYPKVSISSIIKGKELGFKPDLKNAFEDKEIIQKNEEKLERRKKEEITSNEDLRRFLGYESGVLPYTNIFWNVTMQVNQGGKFTEIGYIFFLFLPLIFIFLPFFRNKNFYFFIIIFCFLQLLIFIKNPVFIENKDDLKNISKEKIEKIFTENSSKKVKFIDEDRVKLEKNLEKNNFEKTEILALWDKNRNFSQTFRDFLAKINLPNGYFFIFFIFFSILFILISNIYKNEKTFIFRLTLIFSSVYIYFWTIASFSIVWYGITMYFTLFLLIGYGLKYISEEKNQEIRFFGESVILIIFLSFFIYSLIPHTVGNFKEKGFTDYKLGKKTYLEQSFDLRNNYEKILFELNIGEENKKVFLEQTLSEKILENEFFRTEKNIKEVIDFLKEKSSKNGLEAKKGLLDIYKGILYPKDFYKNNEKIFRIGTFFKYYIFENNKRIFEDGLLFYFYDYILENDINKTVENFKKLGFKYLLIDLGTATIDDSDEHFLTKRYEKLLKILVSNKLELFETDSVCIRFANDNFKKDNSTEKFFENSSITYESYDENNKKISRNEKLKKCAENIEIFLKNGDLTEEFKYLKRFQGKTKDEIYKNLEKGSYVIYKIKN